MVYLNYYHNFDIDRNLFKKYGEFWYRAETDELFWEIPWFLPVKLMIKNLSKEDTYICATHWFRRLPTCLRGGINLEYLKREIEQIKLITRGRIMLHAGCYLNTNMIGTNGTLITGFTNMGKTYQVLKNRKYGIVSDEYVSISPDLVCMGIYRKMAITQRHIKDFGLKVPFTTKLALLVKGLLSKLVPMLIEPIIWWDLDIDSKEYEFVATIQEIKFLPDLDNQRFYQRLVLTTENEFPFFNNYVLQCYSYVTGYPLEKLQIEGRKIIWEITQKLQKGV